MASNDVDSTVDQQIGATVRELRAERSQKALAEAMRERGHSWSQATVWSVEQGSRPLRLAEARDLARELGVSVQRLATHDGPAFTEADEVQAAMRNLRNFIARTIDEATERAARLEGMLSYLHGTWQVYERRSQQIRRPVDPAMAEQLSRLNTAAQEAIQWQRSGRTQWGVIDGGVDR